MPRRTDTELTDTPGVSGPSPKRAGSVVDVAALSALWYELRQVPKDDTEGQEKLRQVLRQLRRVTHTDIHPDCPDVEIEVPPHSKSSARKPIFFSISNASQKLIFKGRCIMPRCRAHQLLSMVANDREVEANRMIARSNIIVLDDNSRISDMARKIAEA